MHDSTLRQLLGPPERTLRLPRGAAAFHRGDLATAVFEVVSGRVRLERTPADGSVLVVGVLTAGDGLAEASIFSDHYHCDAVAEVATRLAAWESRRLHQRLADDPDLARRWLQRSSGQVRQLRARIELRSLNPLTERILAWLRLRDAGFGGARPEAPGGPPLRAVADELGVSPEALYRALAELEGRGAIRRQGREIEATGTVRGRSGKS